MYMTKDSINKQTIDYIVLAKVPHITDVSRNVCALAVCTLCHRAVYKLAPEHGYIGHGDVKNVDSIMS